MGDAVSMARRYAKASLPVGRRPQPTGATSVEATQTEPPLRVQLRSFLDDAAAVDRAGRLLNSLGPCSVRLLVGEWASQLDEAQADAVDSAPSAIVMLTGPARLPGCCSAMRALHATWPGVPLIVFGQELDAAGLAQLVGGGAFDFATLPGSDAEIQLRLRRALGLLPCLVVQAEGSAVDAEPPLKGLKSRLIGNAPGFMKLVRKVPAMAASNASVLLLGETGTGKEVCAQAIHYNSARANGPWVAINCAAIPPDLVEDELFGHVRGAYTHAVGARHGLVHEAEGGTLFLDEINSMPLGAQAKLLRFLQDKQYRVVGASQLRTADVRVIAASNCDLRLAATSGRFRQDLYYRLNVLCLTLPPLRERREDIPLLAMHFLEQANCEAGRHLVGITPAALSCLQEHAWPGNVRELKHVLQRAVLLAQGPSVRAIDIDIDGTAPMREEPSSFREAKAHAVEVFERHYLEQLLVQNEGNISRAARAAQKNRRAFFELLRRHAIDAARYRGLV